MTKAKLREKEVRGYSWKRGEDWHTKYLCDDCLEKYEQPDGLTAADERATSSPVAVATV